MSVYKATSWGRTRRPKAKQNGGVETYQVKGVTATKVEYVTSISDFSDSLSGATEGQNGYATENQRFMHLFVKENSTSNKSINVYGYNYAFGEWAPLFLNLGGGSMTAVNCPSGTSANEGQLFIIDVSGVDRVGFFQTGTDAPDRLRCAFTTF